MSTEIARSQPFSPIEHLEKARKNEQLARALFDLELHCCDWIITICFYSAIHYIYSKLPVNNVQLYYSDLVREIERYSRKLYSLFKSLKDKSEDMRYFPYMAKLFRRERQFCNGRFKELDEIKKILKI